MPRSCWELRENNFEIPGLRVHESSLDASEAPLTNSCLLQLLAAHLHACWGVMLST